MCQPCASGHYGNSACCSTTLPGKIQEKVGKDPSDAFEALLDAAINYPWPGNLRDWKTE